MAIWVCNTIATNTNHRGGLIRASVVVDMEVGDAVTEAVTMALAMVA